jgi:transcriptional regulator with XRE-family HTH domain
MATTFEEALAGMDLTEFGSRLRLLRAKRGLSQIELAGSELSNTYVSRLEAGQRRPDARIIRALASRLETSPEFLVIGVEPEDERELQLGLRFAELALESGEPAEAQSSLRRLREEHDADALRSVASQLDYLSGRIFEALARHDEAATSLDRVRRLGPASEHWLSALILLARVYREAGDLERSIEVAREGVDHLSELGLQASDEGIRLTLVMVAAYHTRGDVAYAAQLSREAIDLADAKGSPQARSRAYWNASVLAASRGRSSEAVQFAERALALLGEGSDERNLARLRIELGKLILADDPDKVREATTMLKAARRDLMASGGSKADVARCDHELARAHLIRGQLEQAERIALQASEGLGDQSPIAAAALAALLGRIAAARNDPNEAQRLYASAVAILTGISADREAAELWFQLGALFDDAGNMRGAHDAYRNAAAAMGVATAPLLRQRVVAE